MKYTEDQKRVMYKSGSYKYKAPQVCTAQWNDDDWIKFIDAHAGWLPPDEIKKETKMIKDQNLIKKDPHDLGYMCGSSSGRGVVITELITKEEGETKSEFKFSVGDFVLVNDQVEGAIESDIGMTIERFKILAQIKLNGDNYYLLNEESHRDMPTIRRERTLSFFTTKRLQQIADMVCKRKLSRIEIEEAKNDWIETGPNGEKNDN